MREKSLEQEFTSNFRAFINTVRNTELKKLLEKNFDTCVNLLSKNITTLTDLSQLAAEAPDVLKILLKNLDFVINPDNRIYNKACFKKLAEFGKVSPSALQYLFTNYQDIYSKYAKKDDMTFIKLLELITTNGFNEVKDSAFFALGTYCESVDILLDLGIEFGDLYKLGMSEKYELESLLSDLDTPESQEWIRSTLVEKVKQLAKGSKFLEEIDQLEQKVLIIFSKGNKPAKELLTSGILFDSLYELGVSNANALEFLLKNAGAAIGIVTRLNNADFDKIIGLAEGNFRLFKFLLEKSDAVVRFESNAFGSLSKIIEFGSEDCSKLDALMESEDKVIPLIKHNTDRLSDIMELEKKDSILLEFLLENYEVYVSYGENLKYVLNLALTSTTNLGVKTRSPGRAMAFQAFCLQKVLIDKISNLGVEGLYFRILYRLSKCAYDLFIRFLLLMDDKIFAQGISGRDKKLITDFDQPYGGGKEYEIDLLNALQNSIQTLLLVFIIGAKIFKPEQLAEFNREHGVLKMILLENMMDAVSLINIKRVTAKQITALGKRSPAALKALLENSENLINYYFVKLGIEFDDLYQYCLNDTGVFDAAKFQELLETPGSSKCQKEWIYDILLQKTGSDFEHIYAKLAGIISKISSKSNRELCNDNIFLLVLWIEKGYLTLGLFSALASQENKELGTLLKYCKSFTCYFKLGITCNDVVYQPGIGGESFLGYLSENPDLYEFQKHMKNVLINNIKKQDQGTQFLEEIEGLKNPSAERICRLNGLLLLNFISNGFDINAVLSLSLVVLQKFDESKNCQILEVALRTQKVLAEMQVRDHTQFGVGV